MSLLFAARRVASPLVVCPARQTRGVAVPEPDGYTADPEAAAATLLVAVTSGLSVAREPRAVRQQFEEDLRGVVRARSVSVGPPTAAAPIRPEVLTFDVPAGPWAPPARLEAIFEASRPVCEWQRRTLALAAPVAALIVRMDEGGPWSRLARIDGAAPLIGSSQAIRRVRDRIERVAATDFTSLIEGESGTGKELVARQIHELSPRRRGPFVAVNCAAIVESLLEAELFGIEDRTATGVRGRRGKFEAAHGGTLFLDEVSDLAPAAQAKLLRAIQDLAVERVGGNGSRRVNTRIIAATNRPLSELVDQKRFRLDLFYRLNGIDIQVPPLRARKEDIVELALYFLERYRAVRPLRLSVAAADTLLAYSWPGNVRELERVIERAVALADGDAVEVDDLPPAIIGGFHDVLLPAFRARESMRAWGSRYARLVLERCANNKRQACRELGISYHTLQAYLRFRGDKPRRRSPTRA
jgi:DNA-binding NtrC family response regulator